MTAEQLNTQGTENKYAIFSIPYSINRVREQFARPIEVIQQIPDFTTAQRLQMFFRYLRAHQCPYEEISRPFNVMPDTVHDEVMKIRRSRVMSFKQFLWLLKPPLDERLYMTDRELIDLRNEGLEVRDIVPIIGLSANAVNIHIIDLIARGVIKSRKPSQDVLASFDEQVKNLREA